MSHSNKGTDHAFSLEYFGLRSYINGLHKAQTAVQFKEHPLPSEEKPIRKMGYAVYPARDIKVGEVVREADLVIKSPMDGLMGWTYDNLIGKVAQRDLKREEILSEEDFA